MPFKIFQISLCDPESGEAELNSFLSRHRVISVEKRFIESGGVAGWTFCVDYAASATSAGTAKPGEVVAGKGKGIDYREILPPEQFAQYARLRDLRKELAEKENVPAYNLFTNDQLNEMVQKQINTMEELKAVPGVGPGRMEKYAPLFLPLLGEIFPPVVPP